MLRAAYCTRFATCFSQNISKLANVSSLGFAAMVYVTVMVAYHYYNSDDAAKGKAR